VVTAPPGAVNARRPGNAAQIAVEVAGADSSGSTAPANVAIFLAGTGNASRTSWHASSEEYMKAKPPHFYSSKSSSIVKFFGAQDALPGINQVVDNGAKLWIGLIRIHLDRGQISPHWIAVRMQSIQRRCRHDPVAQTLS
jgi:hypothetical protein